MSKWRISNYLCSVVCVLQSLCLSGTTCEPFFLSFSGCLSLPPSFWFILSPFNVPAPPSLCEPEQTTPVLSTHNSSSGVSKLDKFFVSFSNGHRKGTRVPHGGCFCPADFLNMWIILTDVTYVWMHLCCGFCQNTFSSQVKQKKPCHLELREMFAVDYLRFGGVCIFTYLSSVLKNTYRKYMCRKNIFLLYVALTLPLKSYFPIQHFIAI